MYYNKKYLKLNGGCPHFVHGIFALVRDNFFAVAQKFPLPLHGQYTFSIFYKKSEEGLVK